MNRTQQRGWALIALIAAFVSLGAWALSSPIGSSPDDDYHNASIWCGQGFREGLCEEGGEEGAVVVATTLIANSACFAFHPELSGACPQSSEPIETFRSNADGGYPPIFYWTMSWLASDNLDASIIAMRLVNAALAIALLAATLAVLPREQRQAPLFAVVATAMPLGIFVLASVNPSSWTYVSLVTFFASFVAFLREESSTQRWKLVSLSAVSMLMGAGTRADAGVYIVLAIALAWILVFARKRVTWQNVGASAIFAGLSYLFYRGAGQAGYWGAGSEGSGVSSLGEFAANLVNLPMLWVGVFGTSGLGWLDTEMPSSVWVVGLGLFTAILFMSVSKLTRSHGVALLGAFGAVVAVPMYMLTINDTAVGASVQPRYIMPLMALVVAVALYRFIPQSGVQLSRVQLGLIGVGLAVANLVALHTNTLRYVSGNEVRSVNLDENIDWWWASVPVSPSGVWLIGSVAFAVMTVALWKLREPLGLVESRLTPA
ncbi:MAG: DUF2142 domain-containing protein [Actinobacteria bacterium]|uniref:Unannotated protein n=1 Tax=freshwater metagenome TaxID=449393 RepID=A0A6J6G5L9_9ZZZZ|nr:DUF2142 domain-containing protein [Actinomycetota bacterium]